MSPQRLRIVVIKAEGLPAADSNGLSDPYLVGELEGKPGTKFQTESIPKTLRPEWDQEFVVDHFEQGDMLSLKIFDYDNWIKSKTVGDDFLCAVMLFSDDFYPYGFDDVVHMDVSDRYGGRGGVKTPTLRLKISVEDMPPRAKKSNKHVCGEQYHGKQSRKRPTHNVMDQLSSSSSAKPQLPLHQHAGGRSQHSPSPGSPALLRVQIHSATNLRCADSNGTSDPYVMGQLRGKRGTEFRTRTVEREMNPQWHEDFEVTQFVPGDVLDFTVYDADGIVERVFNQGNDDLLGRVSLETEDFWPHGCSRELILDDAGPGRLAILRLSIIVDRGLDSPYDALLGGATAAGRRRDHAGSVRTKSPLSDRHSAQHQRHGTLPPGSRDSHADAGQFVPLEVVIVSASGLQAKDWGGPLSAGTSDPYVIGRVVGRSKNTFRSKTVDRDLNPVWNDHFDVLDFEPGDSLEFKVYDEDNAVKAALMGDDFLGEAVLHSHEFFPSGFDNEVPLTDPSCHGDCGAIRLRVQVPHGGASDSELVPLPGGLPPTSTLPLGAFGRQHSAHGHGAPQRPGGKRSRARAAELRRVKVTIEGASGLDTGTAGAESAAQPYCTCEVPSRPHTRFATDSCHGSVEPRWGARAEFDYVPGDPLEFSVFDRTDELAGDRPLGRARLTGRQFFPHGFDAELLLEGEHPGAHHREGHDHAGRLHVRIDVMDALPRSHPSTSASSSVRVPGAGGALVASAWGSSPGRVSAAVGLQPHGGPGGVALSAATLPSYRARGALHAAPETARQQGLRIGERTALLVAVRELRSLRAGSFDGRSHLRCVCESPGRAGSGFQTGVGSSLLGGTSWNHEQEMQYVVGDALQFSIIDAAVSGLLVHSVPHAGYPHSSTSSALAFSSLTGERFYPHGLDTELTVVGNGTGIIGTLSVRIAPVGLHSPAGAPVTPAMAHEQRAQHHQPLHQSPGIGSQWRLPDASAHLLSAAPAPAYQSPLLRQPLDGFGARSQEREGLHSTSSGPPLIAGSGLPFGASRHLLSEHAVRSPPSHARVVSSARTTLYSPLVLSGSSAASPLLAGSSSTGAAWSGMDGTGLDVSHLEPRWLSPVRDVGGALSVGGLSRAVPASSMTYMHDDVGITRTVGMAPLSLASTTSRGSLSGLLGPSGQCRHIGTVY